MKIVADENIPYVAHYFGPYGEVVLKPGRLFSKELVKEADLLLVRSVTKVNADLLEDTKVKWIGSVATGTNHLDIPWLQKKGIPWGTSAGCNSVAVVEYVVSVVAALQQKGLLKTPSTLKAGVIGVGRIGKGVVKALRCLGFNVIQCDPFRAMLEAGFESTPLEAFESLDFITLHTPLTYEKPFPTYHMIEKNFLKRQKAGCILLNASRGEVLNTLDFKEAGKQLIGCFDVWEQEPFVDLNVMNTAFIATPHVAGYSVQSKLRGIQTIAYEALHAGALPQKRWEDIQFPQTEQLFNGNTVDWREVVLSIYDPRTTTTKMKENLAFDTLREQFPPRYEFAYTKIRQAKLSEEDKTLLLNLGINECD